MKDTETETFQLRLQNGQTWQIIGYDTQCDLVRQLAHLMNLQAADSNETAQQLIFVNETDPSLAGYESDALVFFDQQHRVRVWWHPEGKSVHVEVLTLHAEADQYFVMRMGVQMIHHQNVMQGGLPLHAALIAWKGQGVLLAARGGTGKTTCCQRLPDDWTVLGDDEVLVAKTGEAAYVAHPLPTWSHYMTAEQRHLTWQAESVAPVRAVFLLEQAEADHALPIQSVERGLRLYAAVNPIYRMFWRGLASPQHAKLNTLLFHQACDMAQHIPVAILQVSRHGRFWEQIERFLRTCYA